MDRRHHDGGSIAGGATTSDITTPESGSVPRSSELCFVSLRKQADICGHGPTSRRGHNGGNLEIARSSEYRGVVGWRSPCITCPGILVSKSTV